MTFFIGQADGLSHLTASLPYLACRRHNLGPLAGGRGRREAAATTWTGEGAERSVSRDKAATRGEEAALAWRILPAVCAMSSKESMEDTTSRTTSGKRLTKMYLNITPSVI